MCCYNARYGSASAGLSGARSGCRLRKPGPAAEGAATITVWQDRNEARAPARRAKEKGPLAHVPALYPGSRSVEILRERYDEPTAIIERVTLRF